MIVVLEGHNFRGGVIFFLEYYLTVILYQFTRNEFIDVSFNLSCQSLLEDLLNMIIYFKLKWFSDTTKWIDKFIIQYYFPKLNFAENVSHDL